MGGMLAQTDIEFRTALVRAPEAVVKVSSALPLDAIGLPNLGAGSGVLEVTFADASGPNDTLELFIIGGSPANAGTMPGNQQAPAGVGIIVLECDPSWTPCQKAQMKGKAAAMDQAAKKSKGGLSTRSTSKLRRAAKGWQAKYARQARQAFASEKLTRWAFVVVSFPLGTFRGSNTTTASRSSECET